MSHAKQTTTRYAGTRDGSNTKNQGYYVSMVGLNEATIKKYIQEQEKHV
jgi:REP element-mobilizing transposase RayT